MGLSNVDTGRLMGLKYKLICHFKLVAEKSGNLSVTWADQHSWK